MTQVTLQTHHHRSIKHFIPGLALTAVITGAAVWAGSIPAIAGGGDERADAGYSVRDGHR
ncbi:Uncharacterised protein [Kluyvera cryocrescens]|uniref:Uncharacterized protein n=1 Tax=Kluyvera cryocrescens TaxID=580 RepID=A0A485C1B8_KLUCR|nr:Uncharacterised protein [Kluyvera cryocrescens]